MQTNPYKDWFQQPNEKAPTLPPRPHTSSTRTRDIWYRAWFIRNETLAASDEKEEENRHSTAKQRRHEGDKDQRQQQPQEQPQKGVTAAYLLYLLEKLKPDSTTRELATEVVLPVTKGKCSLVDVLAPQFVGIATVFVSHSYQTLAHDSFKTMLAFEGEHPGSVFWYDPFCLHHENSKAVVDTAVLEAAFTAQVRGIGQTLIIGTPWSNPHFLSRAWCLFELLTSVDLGVPLHVRIPPSQQALFLDTMRGDLNRSSLEGSVHAALARIDSRRAQAREQRDLEFIRRRVESTVGFHGLNSLALKEMRRFWIDSVMAEERKMREMPSVDTLALARLQCNQSKLLLDLGHNKEAERAAREAVRVFTTELGERDLSTMHANGNLAEIVLARKRYVEARELLERLVQLRTEVLGADHKDTLMCCNDLAIALQRVGEFSASEELYRRTMDEKIRVLGAEHHSVLSTCSNLAFLLKKRGKLEEAEGLFRQTLAIQTKTLGTARLETLICANNLGLLLQKIGNFEEAEMLFLRVHDSKLETLGPDHPSTKLSKRNLNLHIKRKAKWEAKVIFDKLDNGTAARNVQASEFVKALQKDKSLQEYFGNEVLVGAAFKKIRTGNFVTWEEFEAQFKEFDSSKKPLPK